MAGGVGANGSSDTSAQSVCLIIVRKVLALSLVLNLAFAGVLAWRLGARSRGASMPAEPAVGAVVVSNESREVRRVAVGGNAETNRPPAPWSLIETNDYRAYIANLRAAGCPEPTVRHILIADIQKMFEARHRAEGLVDEEDNHWLTASQTAARERRKSRHRRALTEQQRGLIKELLGVDWWEKTRELLVSQPEVELYTGFLPEDTQLKLIDLVYGLGTGKEAIEQAAGRIMIAEDEEKVKQLADDFRRSLAGLMAPAQWEETTLRLLVMEGSFKGGGDWPGLELTGVEFREMLKLKSQGQDVLAKMLDFTDETESAEVEQAREELFHAGLKELLGKARFAAYVRSQDDNFIEVWDVAKKFNLPVEPAARAYEVRQATQAEVQRLREDPSLSGAQREAAMQAMGAEVRRAVQSALGAEAAQEYLKQHGNWVPGVKPEKNP